MGFATSKRGIHATHVGIMFLDRGHYIQPEDNVRPGEGELWRDGDGGGVDVVGEVEEVVVVLGCGGGFPQPGAQFNLISTDFTTDISPDVYVP